jgi:hypothetical protein
VVSGNGRSSIGELKLSSSPAPRPPTARPPVAAAVGATYGDAVGFPAVQQFRHGDACHARPKCASAAAALRWRRSAHVQGALGTACGYVRRRHALRGWPAGRSRWHGWATARRRHSHP